MKKESEIAKAISEDYFNLIKEIEEHEDALPLPNVSIGMDPELSHAEEQIQIEAALRHYSSISRRTGQFNVYAAKAIREYGELRKKVTELDQIRQELLNEVLRLRGGSDAGEMPLFNLVTDEDGKTYKKEIPQVVGTFEFTLDDLEI